MLKMVTIESKGMAERLQDVQHRLDGIDIDVKTAFALLDYAIGVCGYVGMFATTIHQRVDEVLPLMADKEQLTQGVLGYVDRPLNETPDKTARLEAALLADAEATIKAGA
jgi:hypothetical protein